MLTPRLVLHLLLLTAAHSGVVPRNLDFPLFPFNLFAPLHVNPFLQRAYSLPVASTASPPPQQRPAEATLVSQLPTRPQMLMPGLMRPMYSPHPPHIFQKMGQMVGKMIEGTTRILEAAVKSTQLTNSSRNGSEPIRWVIYRHQSTGHGDGKITIKSDITTVNTNTTSNVGFVHVLGHLAESLLPRGFLDAVQKDIANVQDQTSSLMDKYFDDEKTPGEETNIHNFKEDVKNNTRHVDQKKNEAELINSEVIMEAVEEDYPDHETAKVSEPRDRDLEAGNAEVGPGTVSREARSKEAAPLGLFETAVGQLDGMLKALAGTKDGEAEPLNDCMEANNEAVEDIQISSKILNERQPLIEVVHH